MWPFRRKKSPPEKNPTDTEVSAESVSEEEQTPRSFVITDTLDLHGFFPEQIPSLISDFIDNAQHMGLGRLRIIHGKGKSRLKWEMHQVLKNHPDVESFKDAPQEAGGWGATVVLLREVRKMA